MDTFGQTSPVRMDQKCIFEHIDWSHLTINFDEKINGKLQWHANVVMRLPTWNIFWTENHILENSEVFLIRKENSSHRTSDNSQIEHFSDRQLKQVTSIFWLIDLSTFIRTVSTNLWLFCYSHDVNFKLKLTKIQ